MIPSFVLVCDELPDRQKACREHFQSRGIVPTYWKGFHGNSWGLRTSREYDTGKRISPGHVGLNLGSWAMWQAAHVILEVKYEDPDHKPVLFFEDDAFLPEDFDKQLTCLQNQLITDIPDWDLVFLGLAEHEPNVWGKITERIGGGDSKLCRLCEPFGTHALMVRHRAIPILLEHMRHAERNLDQQLWKYVLQPGHLKWCAVLPSIVTQRTFDYDGTGKPEWGPSCIDTAPEEDEDTYEQAVEKSTYPVREPPLSSDTAYLELIDPLPCYSRGNWTHSVGKLTDKRTIPLAQCARFNQLCFVKTGGKIASPASALSCEHCKERVYVTPQNDRPRLPLPDGHFNPSMIEYEGKLILATRDSWGHSKVSLWEMTNTQPDWQGQWFAKPIASLSSEHPEAPRLEDPRLFIYEGRLHAVFSLPDGYPPKFVKVGWVRFSSSLDKIEHTEVMESPHENKYEKNWLPIIYQDRLYWLYAHKPITTVMGQSETWNTPNKLEWTGGVIRGGCTPIRVRSRITGNEELWSIFHGVLKRVRGSVYSVGCSAIEPHPPFRVVRQTAVPFIWPDSIPGDESVVKRYVVFPGGAVLHNDRVHIAMGVDDTFCRISSIEFDRLDAMMTSKEEKTLQVDLSDTVMATGGRK